MYTGKVLKLRLEGGHPPRLANVTQVVEQARTALSTTKCSRLLLYVLTSTTLSGATATGAKAPYHLRLHFT